MAKFPSGEMMIPMSVAERIGGGGGCWTGAAETDGWAAGGAGLLLGEKRGRSAIAAKAAAGANGFFSGAEGNPENGISFANAGASPSALKIHPIAIAADIKANAEINVRPW